MLMPEFEGSVGLIEGPGVAPEIYGGGPGYVIAVSGQVTAAWPTQNAKYRLTVGGAHGYGDYATATTDVVIDDSRCPVPVITSFVAAPSSEFCPGGAAQVHLIPEFRGGTGSISGVGPVHSELSVPVRPTTNTRYTLTVIGSNSTQVSKHLDVRNLGRVCSDPPTIGEFSASATTLCHPGEEVVLTSVFESGTDATITTLPRDSSRLDISVTSGESVTVRPTDRSTNYQLTVASIHDETVTTSYAIVVNVDRSVCSDTGSKPEVISFSADKSTVCPGETVTITPVFEGTGLLSHSGAWDDDRVVESGEHVTVHPTRDKTYYRLTVFGSDGSPMTRFTEVRADDSVCH